MASPSPSLHRPVAKQKLPENSLEKSNGASSKVVDAALEAAGRTFSSQPAANFDGDTTGASKIEPGRSKLKGAFLMPIDRIRPDPNQPRKQIAPDHLRQLVASIKRVGILQPITLQYIEGDDIYQILSGECRFTAARAAGLKNLPVWVKTPKNEEVLLHQVIENWHRSDLNPFDLADSLAQLKDANGLSQADLSRSTGKNKSEISRLLSLLDLDADVQKLARDDSTGRITKRHLFAVARLKVGDQMKLVNRIVNQDLTAMDVERYVQRIEQPKGRRKTTGAPVTRRKYTTKHASVLLTFRKKEVNDDDVLFALQELRGQIRAGRNELN